MGRQFADGGALEVELGDGAEFESGVVEAVLHTGREDGVTQEETTEQRQSASTCEDFQSALHATEVHVDTDSQRHEEAENQVTEYEAGFADDFLGGFLSVTQLVRRVQEEEHCHELDDDERTADGCELRKEDIRNL